MNLEIGSNKSYKNIMTVLALLGIITLFAAIFITDLFLYASAAFFAVFLLIDKSPKKVFSIILFAFSLLVAVLYNLLAVPALPALHYNVYGAAIPVLAFLIAFMFSKKRSKAEAVAVLCSAIALFIVIDMYLGLADQTGVLSFSENKKLLLDTIADIRRLFVETISGISFEADGVAQAPFSEEFAGGIFDGFLQLFIGLLFIPVFIGAGILCKIFSYITFLILPDDQKDDIIKWHFTTTNVVAYFYCVLFLLNAFVPTTSAFGVTVANLNIIFTAIYAYIGFGFAVALLSVRRKRSYAYTFIIIAILLLPTFAFQILSLCGVFCTVMGNKASKNGIYSGFGQNNGDKK